MAIVSLNSCATLHMCNNFCKNSKFGILTTKISFIYQNIVQCRFLSQTSIHFNLEKYISKNVQMRQNAAHETAIKEKHKYKEDLRHLKSKVDFAKFLKASEVFNEKGIIALNKPYGMQRYKSESDGSDENLKPKVLTKTTNFYGNSVINDISLEDTLPILKKLYNSDNLQVFHFPERWMSGIMLLALEPSTIHYLKKSKRRAPASRVPNETYRVITQGKPVPETFSGRVGVQLRYICGKSKMPIVKEKMSQTQALKDGMKSNLVHHKTLFYNEDTDTSIVEVNVLNNQWHFIRCWMAHCYSPILGDNLFSNRVQLVAGKRISVKPSKVEGYRPPFIPNKILEKLNLRKSLCEIIPCHIHHSKLEIVGRKQNFEIEAPEPSYFSWTREQLGLEIPDMEDFSIEQD